MFELFEYPNVVGFGKGEKVIGGNKTGIPTTTVLVTRKLPKDALRKQDLLPMEVGGLPVDVIEVGIIKALKERTDVWRPAPPGVSLGHFAITAGTFGAVVRRNGEPFLLSNNHVLANENNALIGDDILQPGKYDGGIEAIATLEDFVPIDFGDGQDGNPTCPIASGVAGIANAIAKLFGSSHQLEVKKRAGGQNVVDAAIARPVKLEWITAEILEIGLVQGVAHAGLGGTVKKSGRTTGLTTSSVQVVDATVQVQYDEAVATFTKQIVAGPMSQGGDSGSLVVNSSNQAVGLLFAGSDQVTIFNDIYEVMSSLGIGFM